MFVNTQKPLLYDKFSQVRSSKNHNIGNQRYDPFHGRNIGYLKCYSGQINSNVRMSLGDQFGIRMLMKIFHYMSTCKLPG